MWRGDFFCGGGNFLKLVSVGSTFIREMRVLGYQGWVEILMNTLVYSKRVSVRNNLLHSVFA